MFFFSPSVTGWNSWPRHVFHRTTQGREQIDPFDFILFKCLSSLILIHRPSPYPSRTTSRPLRPFHSPAFRYGHFPTPPNKKRSILVDDLSDLLDSFKLIEIETLGSGMPTFSLSLFNAVHFSRPFLVSLSRPTPPHSTCALDLPPNKRRGSY